MVDVDTDIRKRVLFQCILGELGDITKMCVEKNEYDIADKLGIVYQRVCEVERLCFLNED